jgi:hypothetical protein
MVFLAGVLLATAWNQLGAPVTMAQAARAFLASLPPEQLAKATFPLDSEERFNFHFIPRPRKGIPLRELAPEQRSLAFAFLSAGLSQQGFIKASTIMSLEEVLYILEKRPDRSVRDPELYFFSVFGQPSETGVWGWRVEGHHISLNFTVVSGRLSASPNFFGANPREVKEGPRKGLRALPLEEDLGRELMRSFTAAQKKAAIVSAAAYKDILTGASRKAALDGQPSGLSASRMTPQQRGALDRLLSEYANNFPPDIAQVRLDQIRKAGLNLHFAWAGVEQKEGPHYYRIQSPSFLVEYDCTQNDANHIHSIWRDLAGDFGEDLLAAHYRAGH